MRRRGLHLAYCTNVHPAESVEAVVDTLSGHVARVRDRVAPGEPFGTGLRLGNEAALRLAADGALRDRLRAALEAEDLYVFTVNGFPYGDFAAPGLKQAVYAPDWRDPERVAYTLRVAEIMAALPGPPERSLSTVAGGFREDTAGDEALMATHLGQAAEGLARLADRSGVRVRLCLEPEPFTSLELSAEDVRFFNEHLFAQGASARDHLGLCYDCCHQAVFFEDPVEAVTRLMEGGVTIGKVQVSSALHLADPTSPAARAALLDFAEPTYLHQTVARTHDGALLRALDLPDLTEPTAAWLGAEAWRTHFHVPIWWTGSGALGTTRTDWQRAVRAVVAAGACDHLEIETYTWHALPAEERLALEGGDLHACVAAEFAALLDVLPS